MSTEIRISWTDQVDSTNKYMLRQLESGTDLHSGDIVAAHSQIEGRGLDDNKWVSDPGQNLTFSLFFRPAQINASQQFYLNMAVALAVHEYVSRLVPGQPVWIKWPNDILINKDKVSGMLIQHAIIGQNLNYSILGIGLNINQTVFPDYIPNPASIRMYTDSDLILQDCLEALCKIILAKLALFENRNLAQLKTSYLASLFGLGNLRDFEYNGQWIKARIIGISEYGQLQLEKINGEMIQSDLKEIRYLL